MATIGRVRKTDTELDDESIVAYVRAFVSTMSANRRRRQVNQLLPDILEQVDIARARGDRPDVHAIMRKVWLEENGPAGLLD